LNRNNIKSNKITNDATGFSDNTRIVSSRAIPVKKLKASSERITFLYRSAAMPILILKFAEYRERVSALYRYISRECSCETNRLIGVNCARIMLRVIAHLSRKAGSQSHRDACIQIDNVPRIANAPCDLRSAKERPRYSP